MRDGYIRLKEPIDIADTLILKNQHSTEKLARVKVYMRDFAVTVKIHDNHAIEVEPPTFKAQIKDGKIVGFKGYDPHLQGNS
jgi:hypothetical protein